MENNALVAASLGLPSSAEARASAPARGGDETYSDYTESVHVRRGARMNAARPPRGCRSNPSRASFNGHVFVRGESTYRSTRAPMYVTRAVVSVVATPDANPASRHQSLGMVASALDGGEDPLCMSRTRSAAPWRVPRRTARRRRALPAHHGSRP